MLSYNISLLRHAPLWKANKRNLWMVSSIIYLDMYDLALYMGYAIYLSPILFPGFKLYQSGLFCSLILLLSQFAKVSGFIWFNLSRNTDRKINSSNLIIIATGYAGILVAVSGHLPAGTTALLLFIFWRTLQGVAIGKEIGMVINYSSTTLTYSHHIFLYYFILLSGELGAIVSIFFNRLMVSHEMNAVTNDWAWYIQILTGFLFSMLMVIIRVKFPPIAKTPRTFSTQIFITAIRKDWINIFLRSTIVLFQVLLVFIVIFRVPNILHLGLHWNITEVDRLVLFMTASAFIGTNTVTLITRFLTPYQVIRSFYLVSIGVAVIWLISGNNSSHYVFSLTLLTLAFIYGVFVRITPLYLYHVQDFHQRLMLVSRYLSYIFAYTVLGPLSVLMMDFSHFIQSEFTDKGSAEVLLLTSMISLIGLLSYAKHTDKTKK